MSQDLLPLHSNNKKSLAERSFDLRTSGLWAQHASTAPLCSLSKMMFVRREIRTPAHRSGLRPERSALDHSAILTC